MTYQTTLTSASGATAHGIATSVKAFFAGIGQAIMTNSSGAIRLRRVEALQAKSDADLARLGLRREDIVHHVFKDIYYM